VWNAGLMYFNGDFSTVWADYQSDLTADPLAHPEYHYPGSQEYVVSCLHKHGITPTDAAAHFCYSFYEGDCRNFPSETQIACFPMAPKPWDITPRPWCIPPL